MSSDVWRLVEEEAKKRNSSTNNWIETHFLGFFLAMKMKEEQPIPKHPKGGL